MRDQDSVKVAQPSVASLLREATGCGRPPVARDSGKALPRDGEFQVDTVVTRWAILMDTHISIEVVGERDQEWETAIDGAMAWFKTVEEICTRFHALPSVLRVRVVRQHDHHGRCVTVLDRELGVKPSSETREAYWHLLNVQAPSALGREQKVLSSAQATLIGRQREWSVLQTAWRHAADGHPGLVLISGEAGLGKTRLAEEFLEWAGQQAEPRHLPGQRLQPLQREPLPLPAWARQVSA